MQISPSRGSVLDANQQPELRKLISLMREGYPTWGSPKIVAELPMLGIDVNQTNSREESVQSSQSFVTDVENISGPACSRSRINRYFHRPEG